MPFPSHARDRPKAMENQLDPDVFKMTGSIEQDDYRRERAVVLGQLKNSQLD